MRTTILAITAGLLMIGFAGCKETENKLNAEGIKTAQMAAIQFDTTSHDFGVLVEGENVEWRAEFTNTSKTENLIIMDAKPTCGCTVANDWTKEPVKPGGKGVIPIQFNSNGLLGKNHKTVNVSGNFPEGNIVLNFYATVEKTVGAKEKEEEKRKGTLPANR